MDLGYSNRVDPLPYITSDKEPISNQTLQYNVQEYMYKQYNNNQNSNTNTIPIQ